MLNQGATAFIQKAFSLDLLGAACGRSYPPPHKLTAESPGLLIVAW